MENLKDYGDKVKYLGTSSVEFRQLRKIIRGNYDENVFAAEGILIHQKLLKTQTTIKSFIFCPELITSEDSMKLIKKLLRRADNSYIISKKACESLSERDKPNGIISVGKYRECSINEFKTKKDSVVAVLDGLMTPGNIGTVIRTCDGAGVDAVFICNKKVSMSNPKLIKGSMGAIFEVPVIEFTNQADCISWLIENRFNVYLADCNGDKTYKDFEYAGKTALVMGSEGYGISPLWYRYNFSALSIPMAGICDSLNVGAAASIIIYEICMKKISKKKNP